MCLSRSKVRATALDYICVIVAAHIYPPVTGQR